MSKYISGVRALAAAYLKRFFRDKTALFFTFFFPLIFLLIFGSLNRGNNDITFDVAFINHSQSEFARSFEEQMRSAEVFKISEDFLEVNESKEAMGRGEITAIVELPEEFGSVNNSGTPTGDVSVYYQEGNPQGGQTVSAVMQDLLDEINQEITQSTPPLGVVQVSTETANLSPFDYVFSGLLGFTILSLGIFGLANSMPAEKKTGAFRRLRAAPIGASQLVLGNGVAYMANGLISILLMYIAALVIFDFNMRGNLIDLFVFAILGIIMMFGFGLAIGGWAKNENQAAPVTQVVAMPMMFLSGVFFPRFLMPEWLQSFTSYIPLTPIVDGLRLIVTESKSVIDLGPQLAIMGAWTIVIYIVAFKLFRWE